MVLSERFLLARAAGRTLPVDDPTELYRYTSLDSFLAVFWLVQELLRTPDDWERAAYESLIDAAPHGLRYRETFFTPARHLAAGQELDGIVAGLTRGIERAERETGVRAALIADMDRSFGPAVGLAFVESIVDLRRRGGAERVIGVGMDSTELGVDLRAFAPATALAKRNGLRVTAHAGEAVGRRRGQHRDRARCAGRGADRPRDLGRGRSRRSFGAWPTSGSR